MDALRLTQSVRIRSTFAAVVALFGTATLLVDAQRGSEAELQTRLLQLFPAATTFSPKGGDPLHYEAFGRESAGAQTLLGHAFWTTEVVPLERGYDGPITMLVGLDRNAKLTGVIVTNHREPYGSFSVDRPEFAAQFKGKDIRDPFKVGEDVHAVSRATITIGSASRAIRNSARRIARQYLTPPAER